MELQRWRRGLSARRAERIDGRYREAIERLESSGARSAPLLRRTYERDSDPAARDLEPLVYVYDRGSQ